MKPPAANAQNIMNWFLGYDPEYSAKQMMSESGQPILL
jgi:hypothetical protein